MTATQDRTDVIPAYQGEHVSRVQIKTVGAGTGFNGLDVKPIIMDLDDEIYCVVKFRAAESPSHLRDKHDLLVRMQRVHIDEIAPVSDKIAVKALRDYAQEIERLKAEADGQDEIPGVDEPPADGE